MNEIKEKEKIISERKKGNILSAKFSTWILLKFYRATFALFTVFCVRLLNYVYFGLPVYWKISMFDFSPNDKIYVCMKA